MGKVPLRELKAAGMRAARIRLPDALWKHRDVDEGAKLLWCYLRTVRANRERFTFLALRQAVGVCQNSLLKYLDQLESAGWLHWTRNSLRCITCMPIWRGGANLLLSSDILFDNRLSNQAKWLWGVIQRQDSAFTYETLEKETGYCRESLTKYLNQLRQHEWLPESTPTRVQRRTTFAPGVVNPLEAKRNQDLLELSRGMDAARTRPGYSLGQFLLAQMVQFLHKDGLQMENGDLTGMDNPKTGGRLHYDLYLPDHRLAIEFHGRQHDRVTELYPSQEALEAQQERDRLKAELSHKKGIRLLVVRPEQLSFAQLVDLLAPFFTPVMDLCGRWHIYDELERVAKAYRQKVS